jgi:hypothetical protein
MCASPNEFASGYPCARDAAASVIRTRAGGCRFLLPLEQFLETWHVIPRYRTPGPKQSGTRLSFWLTLHVMLE